MVQESNRKGRGPGAVTARRPRVARRLGSLTATLVVAAAAATITASPAGAVDVGDETELRNAFTTAATTQIDLTTDIELADCVTGEMLRNSAVDLVVDGHGFTLSLDPACTGDRLMNVDGTGGLTLRDITVSGGDGNGGGALSIEGPLVVARSTFSANTASGGAGAAAASDTVQVTDSTFVGNTAEGGAGGALDVTGPLTVVRSTFTGNFAAGDGGAVATGGGALVVVNSTFTANTSGQSGGAIWTQGGDLDVVYSDVYANTAPAGANVVAISGTFDIFASVLAQPLGGGANCSLTGVTTTSHGFNLSDEDAGGSCDLPATDNILGAGADPRVGALADNGGPTDTLLPLAGSPLIDAIPTAQCEGDGAAGVATDQRGVERPQIGGCDIGSVEVVPEEPITPSAPIIELTPTFTG